MPPDPPKTDHHTSKTVLYWTSDREASRWLVSEGMDAGTRALLTAAPVLLELVCCLFMFFSFQTATCRELVKAIPSSI